ncbi:hypothetical protein RB653_008339 [Dictyostelium firmibasis]|uniref:Potassium transporter n=1 Tax=Dictyostelium firmibasis TaxID=79012 RepID=A0AAN7TZV5_9MYCE
MDNQNYSSNKSESDSSRSQGTENLVEIREEQVVQSIQRITSLYPSMGEKNRSGLWNTFYLSITAIGCIFGDIGTSPLYVYGSMFQGPPNEKEIIGSLSLILWALIMVVTVKYVLFILNADNNGEGGIIALVSLIPKQTNPKLKSALTTLALCGSSLILGDGVITPAVSLLSAVEGLEVGVPGGEITKWIVPITVVILFFLFVVQSFGTEAIGIVCGPIMILWFFSIGIFGLLKVIEHPVVFRAFNPWEGIQHFLLNGPKGFLLLGTVILCVTGCEALYADLGHTGKMPIRLSWILIVMPSLMLNYLGQASQFIDKPDTSNPFFEMIPTSFFWPMIILATVACVIASQGLISGSFSIINQVISLKFFPPLHVKHTSKKISGQIYIPEVNWVLAFLTLITVIGFKHSSSLIGAYGLGVSMVMIATTIMYIFVLRLHFRYSYFVLVPLGLCFIIMDGLFFTSSIEKIPTGGWYPILIGIVMSSIMLIWRYGRSKMIDVIHDSSPPLSTTLQQADLINRGDAAVFMSHYEEKTPLSLVKLQPFLTHMPYPLFFVNIYHLPVPFIKDEHRVVTKELIPDRGVFQVSINYGYAEIINVPMIIKKLFIERLIQLNPKSVNKSQKNLLQQDQQLTIPPTKKEITGYHYTDHNDTNGNDVELEVQGVPQITYFLSRLRVKSSKKQFILKRLSTFIFDVLLQNSRSEAHYYGIHHSSMMEIGSKIQI